MGLLLFVLLGHRRENLGIILFDRIFQVTVRYTAINMQSSPTPKGKPFTEHSLDILTAFIIASKRLMLLLGEMKESLR